MCSNKIIIIYLAITVVLITVTNAKVLFQQTSSTKCTEFSLFNKGKGERTGGEKCEQGNGGIVISKPKGSARAELRGANNGKIKFEIGKQYYISWSLRLNNLVDNNAMFQWKAYGGSLKQNYPIVVKMIDKKLSVIQFQDSAKAKRENILFQQEISANKWYSNMLGIYVSDEVKGGKVEYWFNGKKQKLKQHGKDPTIWPCETFDGGSVDAKFGIYGAEDDNVVSSFKALVIGESLADMKHGYSSNSLNSDSVSKSNSKPMTVTKAKRGLAIATKTIAKTMIMTETVTISRY